MNTNTHTRVTDSQYAIDGELVSEVFRLLSSPVRVKIIHLLHRDGQLSAAALSERLEGSAELASGLAKLLLSKIIDAKRVNGEVVYELTDTALADLVDLAHRYAAPAAVVVATPLAFGSCGGMSGYENINWG